MTDYPTSKRIAVMYRKTAKSGGSYFNGKLDGARTLVKSSKKTDRRPGNLEPAAGRAPRAQAGRPR